MMGNSKKLFFFNQVNFRKFSGRIPELNASKAKYVQDNIEHVTPPWNRNPLFIEVNLNNPQKT